MGHKDQCCILRENTLGDAVLPLPTNDRDVSLLLSRNRLAGLYACAKVSVAELKQELAELDKARDEEGEEKSQLLEKLEDISDELDFLRKSCAGLVSTVTRICKKEQMLQSEEMKVEQEERNADSSKQLWRMTTVPMPELAYLKVFDGKVVVAAEGDRCNYGEVRFVKLFSRQAGVSSSVTEKAVQQRAHAMVDLLKLFSCGGLILEQEKAMEEMCLLLLQMEKLHPMLFREVLSKNTGLLKKILVLTPEEGSKFMAAARLTWQQRRDMLSMMKRLRGSVLFGSEAKQREYESVVTSLVSTEKLQIEKMILYSTSKAEFPTLCASVKVRDLAPYFAMLVD